MSFPNPFLSFHAKIIALLQARADFYNPTPAPIDASTTRTLVFPKNFIAYTDTTLGRLPGSARDNNKDADFPACYIEEETRVNPGPLANEVTWGQCNYSVTDDCVISITLISADTRLPVISNLAWAAEQALNAAGPKLGLSAVGLYDWKMSVKHSVANTLMIAGENVLGGETPTPRRYCRILVAARFSNNITALTA